MGASDVSILIVEDDKRLATLLCQELSQAGYHVRPAYSGTEALVAAGEHDFELIVLDLNLPDVDGIEVAERLQSRDGPAILMLTARGDIDSRIEGLYAGASDYVTKPFSVHELLARIHVRLRERVRSTEKISWGSIEVDVEAAQCTANGQAVALTSHELRILELLLRNQGRIFSKEDLEERMYGSARLPDSNTIEVFISNLRRKLAAAGANGVIRTVRGMGYVVREA